MPKPSAKLTRKSSVQKLSARLRRNVSVKRPRRKSEKKQEELERIAEEEKRRQEQEALKRKSEEEERKRTEAETKRKTEQERKRKEVKAEIKQDKSEPVKIKPSKPKPDIKAPTEPKLSPPIPPKPRKVSNALKFGAVAGVIVLLITGGWFYYKYQQKQEILFKIEGFHDQVEELDRAIAKADNQVQLKELSNQRDNLSDQVEGLSEQATKVDLEPQLEDLQNRLKQVQSQLTKKEKELIAVRNFPTSREEWDTKSLCPVKKGTWNVVVASIPPKGNNTMEPTEEVRSKLSAFSERFPNEKFAYMQTVNIDGGNPLWAVIIGSGLKKSEAEKLTNYSREIGIATDAYITFQPW
jgi:hypothetical protein